MATLPSSWDDSYSRAEIKMERSPQDKEQLPRILLKCYASLSHPFHDRTIYLDRPVTIGRTGGNGRHSDSSDSESETSTDGKSKNKTQYHRCRFHTRVMSRNHAMISYKDGKFWIRDMYSSNGTFLNDEQLHGSDPPVELALGDKLQFGQTLSPFPQSRSNGGSGSGDDSDAVQSFITKQHATIERAVCATVELYWPPEVLPIPRQHNPGPALDPRTISEKDFVALHEIAVCVDEVIKREHNIAEKLETVSEFVELTRVGLGKVWRTSGEVGELQRQLHRAREQLAVTTKVIGAECGDSEKDAVILELMEVKHKYEEVVKQKLDAAAQQQIKSVATINELNLELANAMEKLETYQQLNLETQEKLEQMTRLFEESEQKIAHLQEIEIMKRLEKEHWDMLKNECPAPNQVAEEIEANEGPGLKIKVYANQVTQTSAELNETDDSPFNLQRAEDNLIDLLQYFEHRGHPADENEDKQSDIVLSIINVLTAIRLEADGGKSKYHTKEKQRRHGHEAVKATANSKKETPEPGKKNKKKVKLIKNTADSDGATAVESEPQMPPRTPSPRSRPKRPPSPKEPTEAEVVEAKSQIEILQSHNCALQERLTQMGEVFEDSCESFEKCKLRCDSMQAKLRDNEQELQNLGLQLTGARSQVRAKQAVIEEMEKEAEALRNSAQELVLLNRRLETDIKKLRISLHAKSTELEDVKLELLVLQQLREDTDQKVVTEQLANATRALDNASARGDRRGVARRGGIWTNNCVSGLGIAIAWIFIIYFVGKSFPRLRLLEYF